MIVLSPPIGDRTIKQTPNTMHIWKQKQKQKLPIKHNIRTIVSLKKRKKILCLVAGTYPVGPPRQAVSPWFVYGKPHYARKLVLQKKKKTFI